MARHRATASVRPSAPQTYCLYGDLHYNDAQAKIIGSSFGSRSEEPLPVEGSATWRGAMVGDDDRGEARVQRLRQLGLDERPVRGMPPRGLVRSYQSALRRTVPDSAGEVGQALPDVAVRPGRRAESLSSLRPAARFRGREKKCHRQSEPRKG